MKQQSVLFCAEIFMKNSALRVSLFRTIKKLFFCKGYLPTIVQNKLQPTQKDFILTD
jgi:hypothetical protein